MQNFDEVFGQVDEDQDDLLFAHQGDQLLEKMGIASYPGMLFNIIVAIGDQHSKDNRITKENMRKFCEYHIKGLGFLSEVDWGLQSTYRDFIEKIQQKENQKGVGSPGAAPGGEYIQQNIRARVQVGPDTAYVNRIDIELTKFTDKISPQPTVLITFNPKPNKSGQVVSSLQHAVGTLKTLLGAEFEEYSYLINSVRVEVKEENEETVAVKVYSQCEELNRTLEGITEVPDRLLSSAKTAGHLKLVLESGSTFKTIFESQNKSLFDIAFQSYKIDLRYKGSPELLKLYDQICVATEAYETIASFGFPSFHSLLEGWYLLGYLSTFQQLDVDLSFDNVPQVKTKVSPTSKQDLQLKQEQLVRELSELLAMGQQDPMFSFIPKVIAALNQHCNSSLRVDISIGKIQLNVDIKLADLGCLYGKIVQNVSESPSQNY